MKMYDMRCPSCEEFAGFKNNDNGRPKCQGCGYVMTDEDTKAVLDAVWKQQTETCPHCNGELHENDEGKLSCENDHCDTVYDGPSDVVQAWAKAEQDE